MHDAAGATEGFADQFSEQATEPDPPASPGQAELVWCLEDHSFCQAFSPDSSLLALVYRKGGVILWDPAAKENAEEGIRPSRGAISLYIAKNRRGLTGNVDLIFDRNYCMFQGA